MPTTKTKAPRKAMKKSAGHSPMPHGSVCGHSGCDEMCKVRYAGPTSHPRDHRLHEIASGMKHVWTASVVAGLAVVLTGAIAYSAVQADTAPKVRNLNDAVAAIWRKLDTIDTNVKAIKAKLDQQGGQGGMMQQHSSSTSMGGGDHPQLSDTVKTCISTCQSTWKSCQSAATDNSTKEACTKTALTCLKACVPDGAPMPPLTTPTQQQGGQQNGQQGGPQGGQQGGDQGQVPGTAPQGGQQ